MSRSLPLLCLASLIPACFNPSPVDDPPTSTTTGTPPGTTMGSVDPSTGEATGDPPSTDSSGPALTSTGMVDSGSSGPGDPCADVMCINGTCVDQGGVGVCECEPGWTGETCDACERGFVEIDGECVAALSCAANPCGPEATCEEEGDTVWCSRVLGFTGLQQSWLVPPGVMSISATALGASGGCALAGLGGEASATIAVNPGETLYAYVGGVGQCGFLASLPGGFNGGGDKFTDSGDSWEGGSGGGATDLRQGGSGVANRVLVAGGGGGRGWGGQAGHGGGLNGETCTGEGGGCGDPNCGGGCGTQTGGGNAGFCNMSCVGQPGVLGVGGASDGCAAAGGGGGGGYYGGGGGAHCSGGGGSSRVDFPGNSDTSTATGVNLGDGELTIRWNP